MAAPHVAGVASLILEKCHRILKQKQLKHLILKLALKHDLTINANQLPNETPNLLINIRSSSESTQLWDCEVESD